MKESKKKDSSTSKKKKHSSNTYNLESWDQNDLEDADEKVLEKRLHQLKLQLQMAQDESFHQPKHSSNKHKKKHIAEKIILSDTDSSESACTLSSDDSNSSFNKYRVKKSSSLSGDEKKRYQRSPYQNDKASKSKSNRTTMKDVRENRSDNNFSKSNLVRQKSSPPIEKLPNRTRMKRSASLDKREIYNRLDTNRWHDKANEYAKERIKNRENDNQRIRGKSRTDSIRSSSVQKDQRTARSMEKRVQKKIVNRSTLSKPRRIKDSPSESAKNRVSYDTARRMTVITRKLSPRDDQHGRHNDRRLDLKVTRRNDIRAGDIRDVNLRIIRDLRNYKEPTTKSNEKIRNREVTAKSHREIVDHRIDVTRERNRINDDRFRDRDKRVHDRIEIRSVRNDNRDPVRAIDRSIDNSRSANSVFDRIRNRYNDRRNAENNQRLVGRVDKDIRKDKLFEKETIKTRITESNGTADRTIKNKKPNFQSQQRNRSPYRDRKELEKTVLNKSSTSFERRFSSPLNSKKVRDTDNRAHSKRKSMENDDSQWNKRKGISKTRSRSKSSERRKRRRSSQEEWRVIDMTSPVLDDELSDDNRQSKENVSQNKFKRTVNSISKQNIKLDQKDEIEMCKQNKTILTDELSDISDEDFNEVNTNSTFKNYKKDFLLKNDKKNEKICKPDAKDDENEIIDDNHQDNKLKDVVDIMNDVKSVDHDKDDDKNESFDSEEETDLFTVSRVSDALGVDWADLVEESKRNTVVNSNLKCVRERWSTKSIFSRIGVSKKYAGETLFYEIEKDLAVIDENNKNDKEKESINVSVDVNNVFLHDVPGLHVYLKDKGNRKRILFRPYKTAISARKDIIIRRRLCNLPIKNLRAQQMIGMCHWIV